MPTPPHGQSPEDPLVRYLLGYLPEAEVERFDERSIVDDEFAARLRVAEDELLDAYIRGTLRPEQRSRFESHYLNSPLRRRKAEFARHLLAAVDGPLESMVATSPLARPARPTRWLIAAAALVLLGIGALLVRVAALQREMADSRRELASAERKAGTAVTQLEEERKAAALAKQALARSTGVAADASRSVALLLVPQTRGGGSVPVLTLTVSALSVPVDLALNADAGGAYEAALRDGATNRIIWRSAQLTADRTRSPQAVGVDLPARLLKPQHYAIDLFNVQQGRRDFAATYTLEVVRR